MPGANMDIELLRTLNSFLGSNDQHNRFLWELYCNPLFRGLSDIHYSGCVVVLRRLRKTTQPDVGRVAGRLSSDPPVGLVAVPHYPTTYARCWTRRFI